jgi:hypothetical protein
MAAMKKFFTAHAYAVLASDGSVITVGHRYRRLPRE